MGRARCVAKDGSGAGGPDVSAGASAQALPGPNGHAAGAGAEPVGRLGPVGGRREAVAMLGLYSWEHILDI